MYLTVFYPSFTSLADLKPNIVRDNEGSRTNIGKREKARSLVTFSTGDFETRVTGLLALTQGSRV